jgi:hypothetical protein
MTEKAAYLPSKHETLSSYPSNHAPAPPNSYFFCSTHFYDLLGIVKITGFSMNFKPNYCYSFDYI